MVSSLPLFEAKPSSLYPCRSGTPMRQLRLIDEDRAESRVCSPQKICDVGQGIFSPAGDRIVLGNIRIVF